MILPLSYVKDFMHTLAHQHPKTLGVFFATEMWERYGFYVVQTLLALYLALHFSWPDKQIYELVGSFTALTYLSPVLGGWIADHLIGQKRAILLGALILLLSYFFLSLSNLNTALCSCLAGIVVGTGLLKPNISSLLGNEYSIGAANRESGFTIFYMGLTTGIIFGTTIPSYLNEHYGWPFAFMSASFGMLIATLVFAYGIRVYKIQDYHGYRFSYLKIASALLLLLTLWKLSLYILNFPVLADLVFMFVVILSVFYVIYSAKQETGLQAKQTIVIGLLCMISLLFWAFYFQMFMSLTLFILRVVNPTIFGFAFPPPYYVGVQSVGMIILGFFLARRKRTLSHHVQITRIGNKFLFSMVSMCIAYGLITSICHFNFPNVLLSPLYLIPAYLFISLAEMLLSPVGLSAITLLASRNRVSTMMGIFFVSLGIGAFLSGKLAKLTAVSEEINSISLLKIHYASSFLSLLYCLVGATLFCMVLNAIIKQLMSQDPT